MSGINQLERALISQRTKEGIASDKERDRSSGRVNKRYAVSELTRTDLIYHYYIGEILEHSHTLEEILKAAYEEVEKSKLLLEYGEYGEQEIKLVERIVELRLKELAK